MVDKIISVFTTAFVITGVGIALRPGSPLPKVIESIGVAASRMQTAAFGPGK